MSNDRCGVRAAVLTLLTLLLPSAPAVPAPQPADEADRLYADREQLSSAERAEALWERTSRPALAITSPHGVDALRHLTGALPPAPRVQGLRFIVAGMSIDADFPAGRGLVVRRDRFDAWLLARAAATPNVDVRLGARYRPAGERMVVGADGKRSMFHCRLKAYPSIRRRIGLSTHVGGLEGMGNRVEVFFHGDGELYVAPTGPDEALVAALFHRDLFRRDGIEHLLRTIPELCARAAHIELTTPVLACSPLAIRVPQVVAPGLLLIGDAAGAPDPITGEGMALALISAVPAAEAIVSGHLESYARTRRQTGRAADRLASLLLTLSRVRYGTANRLLRRPALVPTLLDVATTRRSLTTATLLRALL